jgi:hypothetical protein
MIIPRFGGNFVTQSQTQLALLCKVILSRARINREAVAPSPTIRHNGDMKPDTVTASELADFVYCPESWRLATLGHQSANQSIQVAGTKHHRWQAIVERIAGGLVAVGRLMIALALLALAAWAMIR